MRKGIVTILMIVLMITPSFAQIAQNPNQDYLKKFAQENDFFKGLFDGEKDAKGNGVWLLAGAGLGIFGILAAYIYKPNPPSYRFKGRKPDYVWGYKEGYQNTSRDKNVAWASGGFFIFLATVMIIATK